MKSAWSAWASWAAILLLNMADHGFAVAGYDKDAAKVEALRKESEGR